MPTIKWNRRKWPQGLKRHIASGKQKRYGLEWGDPSGIRGKGFLARFFNVPGNGLYAVANKYIIPHITEKSTVLEIGPGGGRWTYYLLKSKELILVDINDEFFSYLSKTFADHKDKLRFYKTSGYELEGVKSESIDFVFSFGTFVHIEPKGILEYLGEIVRVLKSNGTTALQYSDKNKLICWANPHFSNMTYKKMESFINNFHQLKIIEHNNRLLNNSNIIVVKKYDKTYSA